MGVNPYIQNISVQALPPTQRNPRKPFAHSGYKKVIPSATLRGVVRPIYCRRPLR